MFLPMAVFSPEKHDSNVDGNIGQWEQFSKPNKLRLLMDLIKGWAQPQVVQLFRKGTCTTNHNQKESASSIAEAYAAPLRTIPRHPNI
jgi:hypothetical protein